MFSFSHSEPIVAVGAIIQKNDGDGGVIVRHEVPASTCPLSGLCRVLLPLSLPTGEVFVRFFVDDHNGHRTVKDDAWRPEVVDDALLTIDADIVDEFAYTAITVHAPKLPHALFGLAPSLDVRRTGVDVIEVLPIGVRSASMVVGDIIDDDDGQIVLTQRVSLTWPDIEPSPIAKRERQPVIHDPLPACTP